MSLPTDHLGEALDELLDGLHANNKLWEIADTHFGHRNIVKFQQRPESHESIMLSNWIERVHEHDQILHHGDVFLGPKGTWRRWALICSRLPGHKYLILGNHDKAPLDLYELAGFTIIPPFVADGVAFTHRPISAHWPLELDEPWEINIHGHVHGNGVGWGHERSGDTLIEGAEYINVSVEVRDLAPVQLGGLVDMRARRRAARETPGAFGPGHIWNPAVFGDRQPGDRKPCCGDPGDCHTNCQHDCNHERGTT